MYKIVFFLMDNLAKLPFKILYAISDVFFVLIYYVIGYRKSVVKENLIKSFPEKSMPEIDAIMKEYYHHFCDLVVESIKSVGMTMEEFEARYKVINLDYLKEYGRNKKSVILLSSHHSNWEWVGYLPSKFTEYFKTFAIYKPLSNPHFDEYIKNTRQKYATLVPMKETFRTVLQAQKAQEITMTWMAADQTPAKESAHWVWFLNQDTPFFTGYERLAKHTQQAIFFVDVKKIKRGYYELEVVLISNTPQDDAPNSIIEKYAAFTEQQIIRQPAYWLWSHRRWKHKRD